MRLQQKLVADAQKRRIGNTVRVMVDGPSTDHELVLRGRTEGQAPDIDPLVYLTECDPSLLSPGQFITAEIVGSQGYDLLVRPALADAD
jgi:ribosomal protein S12 methylthiotransferase